MNLFLTLASLACGLLLPGVLYQQIGALRDRSRFTGKGRWLDVGQGCKLYLLESGSGGPTVVFESGIGATSLNWAHVQQAVSRFALTVSYDRAGLGWSSPCTSARTPANVAAELRGLLQCAGIKPPYVLVGHSFGGFAMRRFALKHPEEVASVVLVDPMRCEEWPPVNLSKQAVLDRAVRLVGYAVPIARVGLARLAVTSLLRRSGRMSRWLEGLGGSGAQHVMGRVREEIGKIPREVWPAAAAHWSRPAFYAGLRAHLKAVPESVREMMTAEPIRGIPVLVLTPDSSTPLSEERLRAIADHVRQVIVPASAHWIHLDQPRAVIEAIRAMAATDVSASL